MGSRFQRFQRDGSAQLGFFVGVMFGLVVPFFPLTVETYLGGSGLRWPLLVALILAVSSPLIFSLVVERFLCRILLCVDQDDPHRQEREGAPSLPIDDQLRERGPSGASGPD